MKNLGCIILIVILMFLTAFVTEKIVSGYYKREVAQLKGDASIYQAQSENYAKVLRSIRETADTASPVEKAQ